MSTPYDHTFDFVTVNGVALHARLQGDPSHPVLALINMASHNLHSWEPAVPALLAHFRLLRFDLRGTGKSGSGKAEEFTFSRYADDLCGLMDHYEVQQAFVLGVAYGARTAARFALHHPERLSALCLADVSLRPPVAQTGQRALAEEARQQLVAADEPAPEPQKYWRFYEDREAARLTHTAHEGEPDLTTELASVQVPALVLCGRQDLNLDEARRVAAALPAAELVIMEMTGHGSPLFRPALFATEVIEFARRTGVL
ncbi:MAG: alpha/beta hydrolase [Pseudomonadota bacterium]